MEIFLLTMLILQGMAISLGMGSSTIAIANFFVAIADGKIDPIERKLMGVTYVVLRVAMVIILITTLIVVGDRLLGISSSVLPTYLISQLILTGALFVNAILMTKKIMPSTLGPAIQASSWYSLGIILTLETVGLINFSLIFFLIAYFAFAVIAIILVNGLMSYQKSLRK